VRGLALRSRAVYEWIMPVKKLIDAVVFGLGATAGKRMFEELEEKVEKALGGEPEEPKKPEETPKERAKREKQELAARERAEKEARKARVREEAEVDKELAALKKRIQK
jgi:vacuolar-type H+-ATPase subunit I/STV1